VINIAIVVSVHLPLVVFGVLLQDSAGVGMVQTLAHAPPGNPPFLSVHKHLLVACTTLVNPVHVCPIVFGVLHQNLATLVMVLFQVMASHVLPGNSHCQCVLILSLRR